MNQYLLTASPLAMVKKELQRLMMISIPDDGAIHQQQLQKAFGDVSGAALAIKRYKGHIRRLEPVDPFNVNTIYLQIEMVSCNLKQLCSVCYSNRADPWRSKEANRHSKRFEATDAHLDRYFSAEFTFVNMDLD